MPHNRPRKYDPLATFLVAQSDARVTLTFAELEAIIGAELPPSARQRYWWANRERTWQSAGWLAAGWRVVGLYRGGGSYRQWEVTFARTPLGVLPSCGTDERRPR